MTRFFTVAPPTNPTSRLSVQRVIPIAGFSPLPQGTAPLGSLSSGQNVWIREEGLEPRERLSRVGTNIFNAAPTGAFLYDDIAGVQYPVVASARTIGYLDGDAWGALLYVSGTSNLPPTGDQTNLWFGTSVYLERADLNLGILTNGINPLFAWNGPSSSTGFSTLTEAPIAKDVALLDNSILAWNIRELSSTSRFVQRVQWCVGGNPEDWTGIGSGFEDLVDMRGEGTRIFTQGDEAVLASTEEIWVGRVIGGPFRFQFAPLSRSLGIPYARAALQTPLGLFWLGPDFMVYRLAGRQIEPIGLPIQRDLRETLKSPQNAFFSYHPQIGAVTIHYSAAAGAAADRAWTYHVSPQAWTPQRFATGLAVGFVGPTASSATTWGGLIGTMGSQGFTFNELLGVTGADSAYLLSSTGTAWRFDASATSDDGATVLHSATLPLGLDAFRRFDFHETRLKIAAPSASSLSVGFSGDGGSTVPVEMNLAISASSHVADYRAFATNGGFAPALQVRSTGGQWRLGEAMVLGSFGGSQ